MVDEVSTFRIMEATSIASVAIAFASDKKVQRVEPLHSKNRNEF
jgi:hypothetical protein